MIRRTLLFCPLLYTLLFFGGTVEVFGDVSVQLQQANELMDNGDYGQAEGIYKQIVTEHPGTGDAFQAYTKLSVLYIVWNKQADAQTSLEKILTDFSNHERLPDAIHEIVEECHRLG